MRPRWRYATMLLTALSVLCSLLALMLAFLQQAFVMTLLAMLLAAFFGICAELCRHAAIRQQRLADDGIWRPPRDDLLQRLMFWRRWSTRPAQAASPLLSPAWSSPAPSSSVAGPNLWRRSQET